MVVARMGPGEYFGEIELLSNSNTIATVRAAEIPVKVAALDRDTFMKLIEASEPTREAFEQIVRQRSSENQAAREDLK